MSTFFIKWHDNAIDRKCSKLYSIHNGHHLKKNSCYDEWSLVWALLKEGERQEETNQFIFCVHSQNVVAS